MLIAEFSRVTGLTRDAIRFYVKRGLLAPSVGASGSNRYQRFDASDVQRAAVIQMAQTLGFTIKQIQAMSDEFEAGQMDTARQLVLMRERLAALDQQAIRLRTLRAYLLKKIAWIEGGEQGAPPQLDLSSVQRPVAAMGCATPVRRQRH